MQHKHGIIPYMLTIGLITFSYVTFCNNVNQPNRQHKVGSKFCQILNEPFKHCQRGKIMPNLVTLFPNQAKLLTDIFRCHSMTKKLEMLGKLKTVCFKGSCLTYFLCKLTTGVKRFIVLQVSKDVHYARDQTRFNGQCRKQISEQ